MSALRLARAATGRDAIVKFDGCYHGHADSFLVAAGSGAATLGIPDSPGVPARRRRGHADRAATTTSPPSRRCSPRHGDGIAAVIVEPVAGNMGVVPPAAASSKGLRALCDRHGALLVFDEVMTGFRVAWRRRAGALRRHGPTSPRSAR